MAVYSPRSPFPFPLRLRYALPAPLLGHPELVRVVNGHPEWLAVLETGTVEGRAVSVSALPSSTTGGIQEGNGPEDEEKQGARRKVASRINVTCVHGAWEIRAIRGIGAQTREET